MLLQGANVFLLHCLLCSSAVLCEWSVSHSSTRICGLKGAVVVLPCTYDYPWKPRGDTYRRGEWYRSSESGDVVREHSNNMYPNCSLKIDKLSEEHGGVYHFRFYTALHLMWITDTTGVTLSVTGLTAKESAAMGTQKKIQVTCSASCSLDTHQYVWYKNGQRLPDNTTASILLNPTSPTDKGMYSCAVRGYEFYRSPAVCSPTKQCLSVSYSTTSICALKGSSVTIPCTFKYPQEHSVTSASWFYKNNGSSSPNKIYQNYTAYLRKAIHSCTARLNNISESLSGEYWFGFVTGLEQTYSGLPGVKISVTALQVLVSPALVTEGQRVTLTCSSTCTLDGNVTFVWFRNSAFFNHTGDRNLHFNPVSCEDSGSYSCAVGGHETLSSTAVFLNVTYLPKCSSILLSHADAEVAEGELVTLTCSCDANPAVRNYTWHFTTATLTKVVDTAGQRVSFNMTPDHSGRYYCEAENALGFQSSAEVAVLLEGEQATVWSLKAAVISALAIITMTVLALGLVCFIMHCGRSTHDTRTVPDNTQAMMPHDQGDVQYARIHFSRARRQEVSLHSTTHQGPHVSQHVTRPEEDCVVYGNVMHI